MIRQPTNQKDTLMPDGAHAEFLEAVMAADAIRDNTSLPPYVREDAEICALRVALTRAATILGVELPVPALIGGDDG